MVYPRKSNFSSGNRHKRVFVSFTVNFSLAIMARIAVMAGAAVPRQQITSRVARGNCTPGPSQNRTGASRLIRLLSPSHERHDPVGFHRSVPPLFGLTSRRHHPVLTSSPWRVPPPRGVGPPTRPGDRAPSLPAHYRRFLATTSPSAPVPRLGTFGLGGPPLEPFPFASRRQVPRFPVRARIGLTPP